MIVKTLAFCFLAGQACAVSNLAHSALYRTESPVRNDLAEPVFSNDWTMTTPPEQGFTVMFQAAATMSARHLVGSEYAGACANPSTVLYQGTTHLGACTCDNSRPDVDRVVCLLDNPDCSLGVCVAERDVWIFHKDSGELISRATCLDCADSQENCALWKNVCFYANFDATSSDMDSCHIDMTDANMFCSTCQPCTMPDNGQWGMDFDCFGGFWTSHGQCTDASRIGVHPFAKDAASSSKDDPKSHVWVMAVVIGVFSGVVFLAIVATLAWRKQQQKRHLTVWHKDGVMKTVDEVPHGDTVPPPAQPLDTVSIT